ncbi:AMP-binding enzyme domain-containing protein [Penicillium atrosanguineum]|nr:AMP-binding enzyme domain-containing protein [Penicillium atrosanguineum]
METKLTFTCSMANAAPDFATSSFIYLAWAIIVGSYTSSKDVFIDTSVTSRHSLGISNGISLEESKAAVPIHIHLINEQSIHDALYNIQRQTGPFNKTARGVQRIFSIQTSLQIQHAESCDLVLHCTPSSEGVNISATFNPGAIEKWIMSKILRQLDFIIQQIFQASTRKTISHIEILTPEDADELWTWNSQLPAASEHCVHEIIEEQVHRHPDAQAVCAWDGELTYSALNDLATRFAYRLVKLGVKVDSIVPLCFEKSMWTIVSVLAVLKAGGTFVLLDPQQPVLRLQEIFQQTGSSFVISSEAQKLVTCQFTNRIVYIVDEVRDVPSPEALPTVYPSTAAYLVFTSGSTGSPKGVLIEHVSFRSALEHQLKHINLKQDSRVFDFASYSFDVAVYNMLATLAAGACLCVPSEADRLADPARAMAAMSATVVNLTTSIARLIEPSQIPTLRTLILLGEAVFSADISKWWDKVRVINTYGPCECTPISSINTTATDSVTATRIGTGAGALMWVVDPEDYTKLLPAGMVGELLLEGPILGRGYLNNPGKTSEVFLQDVAWLKAGTKTCPGRYSRLYKTGDLVRYHEDGSLSYVHRKDTQVKIHGQRVELGEIEHRIRKFLPRGLDMQIAVEVITLINCITEKLVLFASLGGLQKQDFTEAKANLDGATMPLINVEKQLRQVLPSYMVPTSYKLLGQIPLTPSGKTDRRTLKNIGNALKMEDLTSLLLDPEGGKLEVSTTAEKHLRVLWSKILGVGISTIRAETSFFHVGGDSLQAIRLVGAVRSCGLVLDVSQVFRNPRLHQLAKELRVANSGLLYGEQNGFHLAHEPKPKLKETMNTALEEFRLQVQKIPASNYPTKDMHSQPSTILLTGSTGTVGTYLLHALLTRPNILHIYCLNRKANALAYHTKNAKFTGRDFRKYAHKVTFLHGTLDQPRFGIHDDSLWSIMQASINVVLHAAWLVNYNLPLGSFRCQFEGLVNLFRFAAASAMKTGIVFISSISAAGQHSFRESSVPESMIQIPEESFDSGYGKSKYIAEHMCEEAASWLGLPITCVRMGQVAGPIEKPGLWNPTEWFPSLMLSSMYLGSIPDSLGTSADSIQWIPVDVVAEIVVDLVETKGVTSAPAHATVLNMLNSRSVSWKSLQPAVTRSMQQMLGYSVSVLPAHAWLERIEQALQIAMQHGDVSIVALTNSLPAVKLLDSLRASFLETKAKQWQIEKALESRRLESLPPVQGSWLNGWIIEWEKYRQFNMTGASYN